MQNLVPVLFFFQLGMLVWTRVLIYSSNIVLSTRTARPSPIIHWRAWQGCVAESGRSAIDCETYHLKHYFTCNGGVLTTGGQSGRWRRNRRRQWTAFSWQPISWVPFTDRRRGAGNKTTTAVVWSPRSVAYWYRQQIRRCYRSRPWYSRPNISQTTRQWGMGNTRRSEIRSTGGKFVCSDEVWWIHHEKSKVAYERMAQGKFVSETV